MATDFNFSELEAFRDKMQELASGKVSRMCDDCANELAARLLRKVVKRTPVGNYDDTYELEDDGEQKFLVMSDKQGGDLRRGWTTGKHKVTGNVHSVDVINPVEYASYVEYGHRQEPGRYVPALGKKLKASWVKGQFMMTKSEREVNAIAQKIVDNRLQQLLKKEFNDGK